MDDNTFKLQHNLSKYTTIVVSVRYLVLFSLSIYSSIQALRCANNLLIAVFSFLPNELPLLAASLLVRLTEFQKQRRAFQSLPLLLISVISFLFLLIYFSSPLRAELQLIMSCFKDKPTADRKRGRWRHFISETAMYNSKLSTLE